MALDAHMDTTGGSGEPKQDCVTDLLTDIRHWCAANKVSLGLALELSRQHFNSEKDEDEDDTTMDRGPVTETPSEPGDEDPEDSGAADLDPAPIDSPEAGN